MGSPFLYRMQVGWTKDGKRGQDVCQIYAIKPGTLDESPWPRITTGNVDNFKFIAEGADGAKSFTVAADIVGASRYLENRDIDQFILHIKDTRIQTSPMEERVTVATITSRDMRSSPRVPISRDGLSMSCESVRVAPSRSCPARCAWAWRMS